MNQIPRRNPEFSRRQLLKYSGLGAAAIAGSSFLTACGGDDGGGGGGPQQTGGILIHGATGGGAKDTIDPHAPVTNPDIARVSNLFEPLLFWNNDYELEPALAESVESSADGKTWTVKMRQGVTFHNGKDVTAEDAWFSLQRVADPKAPLSGGGQLSQILDFESTKVVDATTLELVLKVPYAILDGLLAEYTVGIIPTDFDVANPVGTGAFAYKSFDPGQTSTFTKYADYWGDAAFVDELQIQDFADPSAMVNALQAGPDPDGRQPALQPHRHDQGCRRRRPGLRDRRLDAVHHEGRRRAVLRRPRPPGDAPDRRPPADDRPDAERLRLAGQRPRTHRSTRRTPATCPSASRTSTRPSRCSARPARRASRSSSSPATTSVRSPRRPPTCSSSRPRQPASK